MKKFIHLLFLLALTMVYVGCESHHRDDSIQEEQESAQAQEPNTHTEVEHGGNAGNR